MTSPSNRRGTTESGWPVFAGVLFVLAGIFHVMWGFAAIANDDNFVSDELLFGDLTLWGIVYLIVGGLQLLAAWLIGTSQRSGQILGILLACVSAVNAMFSFGAYPLWSATILIVDLLVIYGLSVHGDDYA
jgi:hypothetical protein